MARTGTLCLWFTIFSNFVNMENTDENVHAPIVNTNISIRNTENVHDYVIQQQDNTDNDVVADFTAGPYVTRRNPTAEIISMLSSLYISDDKSDDDDESCMITEYANRHRSG